MTYTTSNRTRVYEVFIHHGTEFEAPICFCSTVPQSKVGSFFHDAARFVGLILYLSLGVKVIIAEWIAVDNEKYEILTYSKCLDCSRSRIEFHAE